MIYIITNGTYSNYHICAVATTLERAKELQRMYSSKFEAAQIEEYQENIPSYEYYNGIPQSYWSISFADKGEIIKVENYYDEPNLEIEINEKFWYSDPPLKIDYIATENQEKAIKIACDMRAKYLAEKFGL